MGQPQQLVVRADPPYEIRCVECGAVATGTAEAWQAHIVGGYDDEPLEVATYCPTCSREIA